jgi:hypothetical protein
MAKRTARASGKSRSAASFRVELSGSKLPPAARKRLAAAIEKATLAELAAIDLTGDFRISRIRKEWLGIWIDRGRLAGPGLPGRGPVR